MPNRKQIFLVSITVLLACIAALAQASDLSGDWSLKLTPDREYRINLVAKGNSWHTQSIAKSHIKLTLNPAGLKNLWVGTLESDRPREVKARLQKNGSLLVTDLDDGQTWSLTRI